MNMISRKIWWNAYMANIFCKFFELRGHYSSKLLRHLIRNSISTKNFRQMAGHTNVKLHFQFKYTKANDTIIDIFNSTLQTFLNYTDYKLCNLEQKLMIASKTWPTLFISTIMLKGVAENSEKWDGFFNITTQLRIKRSR